jgi:hypothetical protein
MVDKAEDIQNNEEFNAPPEEEIIEYNEHELAVLENYLQATCHQLLDLNRDLLNFELHKEDTRLLVKKFAENKSSRTLVVVKSEKTAHEQDESEEQKQDSLNNTQSSQVTNDSAV